MVVEDVHIVHTQPFQTLIQARQQILPAAPVAVGTVPHIIAGFGADDQFIPVTGENGFQQSAEVSLRRTSRRPVVVRQVEMGDAAVKRCLTELCHPLQAVGVAEVVPQPQGQQGQFQPAVSAAAVFHLRITVFVKNICHSQTLQKNPRDKSPVIYFYAVLLLITSVSYPYPHLRPHRRDTFQ